MDKNWNNRLKESRIKMNLSLKDLESFDSIGLSQQSLIKYEKGIVFPKIDVLEKLCQKYNVTIPYILYGDNSLPLIEVNENTLTTFFSLLFSKKLSLLNDNTIKIDDSNLRIQILSLNSLCKKVQFEKIDDLSKLIKGIKKLAKIFK